VSRNIPHDIVQELGAKYKLTDLQRGALYEHIQAQLVLVRALQELREARDVVDALQLQECVVRREYAHTLVKMGQQKLGKEIIALGVEQAREMSDSGKE